ncbi:MAG: 7,8-dihydro-6-hydroxymethylpterin dimethyltransferase [Pyrinomonadaceae bacterium]|nr:7,8-dihydro-6-hydroxymethylpterin dimethyltransferase [Pyrinomonadaceae bacterium]MDX6269139.1 7,8-dihydro-6-hydroxymethylpterin dimethyltransferase [Acidobacteriota bacterium]
MRPIKHVERGLTAIAAGAFNTVQFFNKYRPSESFIPKWSDKPLLKSWQKSKPPLGFPRTTDSLCPKCVIEARAKILSQEVIDPAILINEKVGEVKAQIVERNGEIWMIKDCPTHGHIEDIMAMDSSFLKHIEAQFPGRDIQAHNDEKLHNHGSSTIKYGRGSVLTIDLTNRCNMMCDPCFMDANQVGFVHELSFDDVKDILDKAISIKPRRQMSVQFSGGEPTISPHFIESIKYSRKVGYNSVQCATNGIEFAKSKQFCRDAADAGLRYAYLQFDGIGNDANSHRQVGNLFDVKLRAIDNLHEAGVEIVLVTTLVNNINNDQVGSVIRFALDNPKKVAFISFQPVSFTGRDEEITDERRMAQRYTLSHLAHDVKKQVGITEPTRDWFPLSLMGAFADFADLVHGPEAEWGQVSCGCHPNCGVGTAVMINKNTKEMKPVPEFLNIPGLVKDMTGITDAGRGKWFSNIMMGLALLKNYQPYGAPQSLTLVDIFKKFDKSFGLSGKSYGKVEGDRTFEDIEKRRADPWNFLFIAGMWFQDLFNYDFRRTEMCIIPYGTQEGEISFCAYNTGIGWRNIIEQMHQNATIAKWYKENGRHEIFAKGKNVELGELEFTGVLNEVDLQRPNRPEMAGPKTAAEEAAMMRKLYQEMVLKQKLGAGDVEKNTPVQIKGLSRSNGKDAVSA